MAFSSSIETPRPAVNKSDYRKDIDGLRAIAVICVIVNHLNHAALPGGYLGVDIFFVISGYVITSSLEKTTYSSYGSQLLHFYSRRIKRLMPALITMCLISATAIRLFDPGPQISTLTGIASVFGLSNFFLFTQALNYFGVGAQRNMFSHTWSLGVEEQFYLLYPFLIRWRRPKSIGSLWDDRFRLGALAALSIVSMLLFVTAYQSNQPAAYFLMPCRFWELGIGCGMALITRVSEKRGTGQPIKIKAVLPLLGLVPPLILAGRFPVVCTVAAVAATALLIGSVQEQTLTYRLLSARLPAYIGSISYSMYLWHWPIICISFWTIGIHLWSLPFQIAAIILLSVASYHLIENPLRRARWFGGRWGVIAIGVPAMACAAALLYLGQKYHLPRFSGDNAEEAALDSPAPGYVARYSNRKIDDCFAKGVFGTGHAWDQEKIDKCTAKTGSGVDLIFVGDSTATDLFPLSDRLYKDGTATVLNVTQPGCKTPPLKSDLPMCDYPDLIIGHSASSGAAEQILVIRTNYSPRQINGDLREFSDSLEKLLAHTSAAKMKVIYIAPSPKYYSVGSLCSPQWFRPEWALGTECQNGFREDRSEELKRRRDVTDYLFALSKKRSDFFVFDPFDTLCGSSENYCTPVRNGQLIYRDGTHLTSQGSELLVAPFEAFLKTINSAAVPPQALARPAPSRN